MPIDVLPREELLKLGVTPPKEGDSDLPRETRTTKLKNVEQGVYRRRLDLTDDQLDKVRKVMENVWAEWEQNTDQLRSKLRRAHDTMEGVKTPKDFPWPNSSNLHIPIIEIHVTILHSLVSSTMLDNDPIAFVKIMLDGVAENVDSDIEKFLNWTCKTKLRIDATLSDIYWSAYVDGNGIGDLDWVEDYGKRFDIMSFTDPKEFSLKFPNAEMLGVSQKQYDAYFLELIAKGKLQIKIEETVVEYRGPKLRPVELKDFVMIPTSSPSMEYAMFVGDLFVQRADYFRRKVKENWFDKDEVEKMLEQSGMTTPPDQNESSQDQIEGIGRTRVTTPDEYLALQGILKINLDDDEMEPERMYLVTFERKTKAVIRFEDYPYWHNRIKYISWVFKKRPGRFLGQSIYDQLIDINDEIDTQHNQRIDSRTISTVPSFLKLETSDIDFSRADQRFYPGVTFPVKNINNEIKQLVIAQTDMGQSMQEEQNLMMLADLRTGAAASEARGQNAKDPRASGKKKQLQLQQSENRVDDHIRELKISTAECFSQILELYYQFSPEGITFSTKDPQTGEFVKTEVAREKLRNRNMVIQVARTTVLDNPNQLVQRYLTIYEMLSKEPLIATNIFRRRELLHRVLTALREKNVDKLVPTVDDILKELKAQEGMGGPAASGPVQNLDEHLKNAPSGKGTSHEPKNGANSQRPMETKPGALK